MANSNVADLVRLLGAVRKVDLTPLLENDMPRFPTHPPLVINPTIHHDHDLKLKIGEERGGIVCSGGICGSGARPGYSITTSSAAVTTRASSGMGGLPEGFRHRGANRTGGKGGQPDTRLGRAGSTSSNSCSSPASL